MIDYELIPGVAVGPVRWGMTREEVRRVMPGPVVGGRKAAVHGFHGSAFRVHYAGTPPVVDRIELSRCPAFRVLFRGVSLFDTRPTEFWAAVSDVSVCAQGHPRGRLGTVEGMVFPGLGLIAASMYTVTSPSGHDLWRFTSAEVEKPERLG